MAIAQPPICQETLFSRVKEISDLLRALSNQVSQQILKLLEQHSTLTVTQIFILLRREQSEISQHLAILRRMKLVHTKREGKHIYYELSHTRLQEINRFIESLANEHSIL